MRKKIVNNKKILISLIIIIVIIICIISIQRHNIKKLQPDGLKGVEITNIDETTISTLKERDEVLINPGKGFVLQDFSSDGYDDIVAIGYKRYNWSDIEPEEGVYNWELIDDKIQEYANKGKKYAFGIMNVNTTSNKQYITPQWVFQNGAKGELKEITYTYNDEIYVKNQMIPDWKDKIFLEKVSDFIKVLAERYDGNPNIAYIDIRSYGNWGEQHLGVIGGEDLSAYELQKLYIEEYMKYFKKTLLVNPWGKKEYNDIYKWSIENGVTIRRDGIFRNSDGTECTMAYGKLPTIFEYTYDYNTLKSQKLWNKKQLLEYVDNGKPSYVQIYKEMYEENKEFCEMLANKIGYYFRFKGAEYTNKITTKEENEIKLNFINEGVAPLYEPCTVYIGLLDKDYNLVKKYKTDIDPHTWMPEEEIQENIKLKLDDIEDGKYIISLGLFLNEEDEKPTYLLGNSGKTDDKWYVFGEIEITNPSEEYNIVAENDKSLINGYKDYNINIKTENLKLTSNYVAKIYINNNLSNTIDINNNEEFNKNVTLKFEEGNNTYKIEIEKDNQKVYETTKELYVTDFVDDYKAISNTANSKYTEFKERFANEIVQIPNLTQQIEQMERYMIGVGQTRSSIVEQASIQAMEMHYEIGNTIMQAYKERKLDIEYVKLSSMLDMLEDIGKSYEDLVTVTAKSMNPELEQTKNVIQDTEKLIQNNEDLGIIYPNKILEFSKDYYEKAEYINSLTEENEIKAGLIISNNLHSRLLANWANTFTNIYIYDYIAQNPVTITYSETNLTNKDVKATITTNAEIEITNNSNSKEYTFKENDSFTFEYKIRGQAFTIIAKVDNIDKKAPIIKGVEEDKIYNDKVTLNVSDENLSEVKLILNEQEIEYRENMTLTEEGFYQITATDKAGNTTSINFELIVNNDDKYQIKDGKIQNIGNNTIKSNFDKELKFSKTYEIFRNNKKVENNDIIATGDILKTQTGEEYTLIVTGDINRDGQVNIKDMIKMRRYLLERNNLDEIEMIAADCNLDGKDISIKDFIRMRLLVLMRSMR